MLEGYDIINDSIKDEILQNLGGLIYHSAFKIAGYVSSKFIHNTGWNNSYVDDWKNLNDGHSVGIEIENFVEKEDGELPSRKTINAVCDYITEHSSTDSIAEIDISGPMVEMVTQPHYTLSELEQDVDQLYTHFENALEEKNLYHYDNALKSVDFFGVRPYIAGVADTIDNNILYRAIKGAVKKTANLFGIDSATGGFNVAKSMMEQYDRLSIKSAGMHVHVGAKDAEEGVKVVNMLRKHIPDIVAFSANSKTHEVADKRLEIGQFGNKLFDKIQTVDDLYGLIRSPTAEARTMCISRFSTIELRVPDSQKNREDSLAVAAYVWGLAEYAKGDLSDDLTYLPEDTELIQENFDAAIQKGSDAVFSTENGEKKASDVIYDTLETLKPVFENLDISDELFDHIYK